MLKPHMNYLLYKVGSLNVCLTPKDIDQFDYDPHDFVRHHKSPLANFYNPQMTATTLVTDLVKNHWKDITQGLLGNLVEIMIRYA